MLSSLDVRYQTNLLIPQLSWTSKCHRFCCHRVTQPTTHLVVPLARLGVVGEVRHTSRAAAAVATAAARR